MGGTPAADTYTYDPIDQVTGVAYAGGVNAAYAYDAAGNRQYVTGAVPGTGSYATNSLNQYTAHNGDVLLYDNRGNLQQQGLGISFAYDSKNRLLSGTLGNHTLSMEYDYRNRVVKRTADGVATYLVYDGWSLIAEYNAAGQLQQKYVHGPAIDELLSKTDANGTVYYHHDGLGSTVALTDASGGLVERYTYDVFGAVKIFDASGLSLQNSAFGNRFFFTGREGDPQTGLYDYRNRVYSSSLGRFLQTDPIRFDAGDGNLYRYVGNRVTGWIDPSGKNLVAIGIAVKFAEGFIIGAAAGAISEGAREFAAGDPFDPVAIADDALTSGLAGGLADVLTGPLGEVGAALAGAAAEGALEGWKDREEQKKNCKP